MDIFVELSGVFVVIVLVSVLCRLLRQPLIVGYIVSGILLGPYFFPISHSLEAIELFSKIGITILLFIVGLSLSPRVIHDVGKIAAITGVGQVLFTSIIGYAIIRFLGYPMIDALYAATALTFSSTIIILKLLSDRGDVHKLYGKIAIGFLLVQDIIATLILVVASSSAGIAQGAVLASIAVMLIRALMVIAVMYLFTVKLVPLIGKFSAKSQELLFLFSVAWGMGFSSLFYILGFSVEIGALIAGVMLATTPYALEIGTRLRPLRDFFITLFFVALGQSLVFYAGVTLLWHTLLLSLFVLVGNPLIVFFLMSLFGYSKRTSFFAGLTVAQISEFSLILMALGLRMGQVSQEIVSLVTMVGAVTIVVSTYFILYAHRLYTSLEPVLSLFSIRRDGRRPGTISDELYDTVLFGYNRVGRDFVESFKKIGRKYVIVDFNPDAVTRLKEETQPHMYGDAGDTEFLTELGFKHVSLVVSTIPEFDTNLLLVQCVRSLNKKTSLIVLSHYTHEARELYEAGASYVIMPHHLGAQYAARMIVHYQDDHDIFDKEREKHQLFLNSR